MHFHARPATAPRSFPEPEVFQNCAEMVVTLWARNHCVHTPITLQSTSSELQSLGFGIDTALKLQYHWNWYADPATPGATQRSDNALTEVTGRIPPLTKALLGEVGCSTNQAAGSAPSKIQYRSPKRQTRIMSILFSSKLYPALNGNAGDRHWNCNFCLPYSWLEPCPSRTWNKRAYRHLSRRGSLALPLPYRTTCIALRKPGFLSLLQM